MNPQEIAELAARRVSANAADRQKGALTPTDDIWAVVEQAFDLFAEEVRKLNCREPEDHPNG